MKIAIVGSGFSGAVVANELAINGFKVEVFESRKHIAGNCYTERDEDTGIMVHVYGPHIFNTSNLEIWNYIQKFDEFVPYVNRVKAVFNNRIYTLPINLLTINTFFKKNFSPKEAKEFISSMGDASLVDPKTFEEQALKFVGRELYEAFFKGYTLKQWGVQPSQLPASILKRLPVRFNYDDNYYSTKYQGMPKNGYTYIIEKMLTHKNIKLHLNTKFHRSYASDYDQIFYTGPIDEWFNFSLGRLGYRTLDFVTERYDGDFQGNAVINYCNQEVPWTRISEHKHFSPWEDHKSTIIYKEYSRECLPSDIPYYPIRLINDKTQLRHYINLANEEKKVTFLGRLGTYRYLDMHVTIAEAIEVAKYFILSRNEKTEMKNFIIDPFS
jgi:UDP-galactopyranose mutase